MPKSREAFKEEQDRALEVYDEVRQELLQIPGVVEVGVGLKETAGQLTERVAFRVYVLEKLSEDAVPSEQRIPKEIRGFPTDVIKRRERVPAIGFNDEDDWKNYSPKVGGIRIGSEEAGGTGTLGCFCSLTSDGSTVFLSNHHVLFSGSAQVGSRVGQPNFEKSCCCTSNVIGEVLNGQAGALDCAIGKLKSDIAFVAKIRNIKKNDGTLELNGRIDGSGAAVVNDEVWKVGARTGLTRGTVSEVTPDVEIQPNAPFPRIANFGDSGSVVIRLSDSQVVGLLKSIDAATNTLGFATNIAPVLTAMGITVLTTPAGDFDVAEIDEDEVFSRLARQTAFASLVDRLQATESGRELLQVAAAHRKECLELVNRQRAVTIAWHRNQGPTWLAALARSAKEPSYRIPDEVQGVSRREAATRIRAAFVQLASPQLRADIERYSETLLEIFTAADTIDELIQEWEEKAGVVAAL